MARDRSRRKSVEKIVVRPVVSETENDVGCLFPVREEAAHVDALVHTLGADLHDLLPEEDLGGRSGEVLAEVVEELASPPGPVLDLRLAEVPGDAARLALDVGSRNVGRDSPEQALDSGKPTQIEVDERSPLAPRWTREVAVLGAQVDGQPSEPLLEVATATTAHDVDVGGRECSERAQELLDLRGRLRKIRMTLELAQGAVVVEHDRPGASAYELAADPLLESIVDGRWPTATPLSPRVAREPREEPLRPPPAVEVLDPLRHHLETALAVTGRQLEGSDEVLDDAVDVPRVDEQRAGEHLRRPGELRQHQRAPPAAREPSLRLAEHELLRDEVHAIAQGRDHHDVRPPVQGHEARLRDVAMDVLDGSHARPREAPVDAGDEQLDLVTLAPVLRALEPGRDEHLDHRGRQGPARVLLQEALERLELLRDPLRVVEPLYSEHEPATFVLCLEIGEEAGGLGVGEHVAKSVDVDPDRVDTDADAAPVQLQPAWLGVDPEDAQAARPEVPCVIAHLKADVVGAEDAAQQPFPLRKQAVDLRRRERDVEEEPDRETGRPTTQDGRDQHQVEVVHPHARVRLAVVQDRVREALVDVDVLLPGLGRDAQAVREVVEQRPERVVADTSVEVLLFLSRDEDREQVLLGEALPDPLLERLRDDRSRPADPRRVAAHGSERRRQPARASLHVELVALDRDAHGQAVARDDETAVLVLRGQLSS